jgi:tripartite-type tricarboxylate transporter receptor subunit TctC
MPQRRDLAGLRGIWNRDARPRAGHRRFAEVTMMLRLALAAVVACFAIGRAAAQDAVAQFYKGKTINIYVGTSAGGGYDTYARLLARHLGDHIPGHPDIVVENMPGAGSGKATGYVYAVAPKDGTALAAIFPGVLLDPLIGTVKARYDAEKFNYIGSANSDVYICYLRSDAPAKTFKDVFAHQVVVGASAAGGTTRDMPSMLDNVLGAKFRVVTGYAGSKEITIAVERNEVNGACGIGWSGLPTLHPDWFAKKFINVIVQLSRKGHPELNKMGVPRSDEFAKTDEERQVLDLIQSQSEFGRPYLLPPGVPAERVAALRKAFVDTLKDPALLAEAKKMQLDLDYMSGEDLQDLIKKLYALPPSIIARAKQALIYTPPK